MCVAPSRVPWFVRPDVRWEFKSNVKEGCFPFRIDINSSFLKVLCFLFIRLSKIAIRFSLRQPIRCSLLPAIRCSLLPAISCSLFQAIFCSVRNTKLCSESYSNKNTIDIAQPNTHRNQNSGKQRDYQPIRQEEFYHANDCRWRVLLCTNGVDQHVSVSQRVTSQLNRNPASDGSIDTIDTDWRRSED